MIMKFHFTNGATAAHLDGEPDHSGNPLVVFTRKVYTVTEEANNGGLFVEVGKAKFWVDGSNDLVAHRDVRLFWKTIADHDLAEMTAHAVFTDYPDTKLLAFGAHNGIVFTQDNEGFKVVKPGTSQEFKGTLEEVRKFIDDNY